MFRFVDSDSDITNVENLLAESGDIIYYWHIVDVYDSQYPVFNYK